MMDPIAMSCSICMEVYSEGQHAPVMLPNCGHTFCRSCLSNLRETCINCPTCRSPHQGLDVETLPVNFAQLTLVDKLKNIQNLDMPKCGQHGQPLNLWCLSQQMMICAMCFFEETKDAHSGVLSLSDFQAQLDTFGDTIRKKASVLSQVYLALKHALSAPSLENVYTRKVNAVMRKNGKNVSSLLATRKELEALSEELSYKEKNDNIDEDHSQEDADDEVTSTTVCSEEPSVRCVAVDSGKRKAKVTWEDGQLHVYAPRKEDWCNHRASISVQMEDVRLLISQKDPTVFLDLADEDKTPLGRVVIRLWGRLRRAQQFLALCDGRLGPTFKGSIFMELNTDNGCRTLVGGQYFTQNGETSYKALMEDLEWDGKYRRKVRRTLVTSFSFQKKELETKFGISLIDFPIDFFCPFGEVVSGMSVVEAAADRIPVTKVKIAEVGVVIPEFVTED